MMHQFTTFEIVTMVAFAVLQIADVYTTYKCLKLGATEANGALAWVIRTTGRAWPLLKLALAIVAGYILWSDGVMLSLWLLNAIYGFVVLSNFRVLKALKDKSR